MPAPHATGQRQILQPAQLNAMARDLLEGSFPSVWVEGEISNLSRPASGHLYFTLKDARAQVRCALFRQRAGRMGAAAANGQQVLARGRLTLYEPRGDYQLVLDHLEPAGEGALRAAFEALHARLAAEGLFDPAGKPPLPRLVRRLGVVTSPRGAAVRDVISVLQRRLPLLQVDVLPVPVQGEEAAGRILDTLARAARSGRYDALLLTRGGGSLEDLWAFNDEALVRWVAASPLPVVAAIGHEIDVTLVELAATLRAPTPSAAAELLVPDQRALLDALAGLHHRLGLRMARRLAEASQGLDRCVLRLNARSPMQRLERGRERLSALASRLSMAGTRTWHARRERVTHLGARLGPVHPERRIRAMTERVTAAGSRLPRLASSRVREARRQSEALWRALHAVGPIPTLERGYVIVRDAGTGSVVRHAAGLVPGQSLRARFADGEARLSVDATQRGDDDEGDGGMASG